MDQLEVPATPLKRVMCLLDDYLAAPDDEDIEIRIGHSQAGEPAVIISVGKTMHALTSTEARKFADIAEGAMKTYPNEHDAQSLPTLILALRAGADKADGTTQ